MHKILGSFVVVLLMFWCSTSFANSTEEKLAQAILDENIVRINVLLRQVDDINAVRYKGKALLNFAQENGKKDAAEFLISRGAIEQKIEINWVNSLVSPAGVKFALSNGGSLQDQVNNVPLLHFAANLNRVSVVHELLKQGAKPNTLDGSGRTILHVFARIRSNQGLLLAINNQTRESIKDNNGLTYKSVLLGSATGQNLLSRLNRPAASQSEYLTATQLAANARDSRALRYLLLATKGKHRIKINPNLLTPQNFEIALILNRYAKVKAERFIAGKSFYQVINDNFDAGYYLVAMGFNPTPKTQKDLNIMADLCQTHDLMPMLSAGGVTTELSLAQLQVNSIFDFLIQNCSADQDMMLNQLSAQEELASKIIPDDLILQGYLPGAWQSSDKKISYQFNSDNTFVHTFTSSGSKKSVEGNWEVVPAGVELKFAGSGATEFLMVSSLTEEKLKGDFGWGKYQLEKM